ncbi:hemerythrin domain-containing protein [Alkalibacillus salilacus]|uniref:Hemerythrin-like domain-containing protein n=1 Tax=Alkalibacillus salilacus TaxID=284582 RepID=A0ABT9VBG8_9BACI|nr:hemerythrin domain-containing protein [Alkalibacillus salilacus]MDQ0158254.1 hemerythrin-like domain-containing protein [Alkalibacillus salilacus]
MLSSQFNNKAMQILENEHRYLQYLMEDWHQIVLRFERNDFESNAEALSEFKQLRKKLIEFLDPLKNHTDKEEQYFFPMLGMYIGKEQGPIVATEEEHQEIDGYIGHFLHHTMQLTDDITYAEMQKRVQDAAEAFEVLTVHMMKEETVLFPMVDRVMLKKDLDQLTEELKTLITEPSS